MHAREKLLHVGLNVSRSQVLTRTRYTLKGVVIRDRKMMIVSNRYDNINYKMKDKKYTIIIAVSGIAIKSLINSV